MLEAARIDPPLADPVSAVLKRVLPATDILTFALMGWAAVATYRAAPPHPERLLDPGRHSAHKQENDST